MGFPGLPVDVTHRCQLSKMNFKDTLHEFQGHLVCIKPSSYPDMINCCRIMKKQITNATLLVVPLVTSLCIFQNGQFVGDFVIVSMDATLVKTWSLGQYDA